MTLSAAHGAAPPRLPAPAGALTEALIEALRQPPHALFDLPVPSDGDDLAGDDMHLALYVCCELAYRGFAGVDGEWEWEPSLVAAAAGARAPVRDRVCARPCLRCRTQPRAASLSAWRR